MAQRSGFRRGPLKVAAKAAIDQGTAENAPKAISHTTIGARQSRSGSGSSQIGSEQGTTIKRLMADDNVIGSNSPRNRPLGCRNRILGGFAAPEAGRRKDVRTGYKPHCGVEREDCWEDDRISLRLRTYVVGKIGGKIVGKMFVVVVDSSSPSSPFSPSSPYTYVIDSAISHTDASATYTFAQSGSALQIRA